MTDFCLNSTQTSLALLCYLLKVISYQWTICELYEEAWFDQKHLQDFVASTYLWVKLGGRNHLSWVFHNSSYLVSHSFFPKESLSAILIFRLLSFEEWKAQSRNPLFAKVWEVVADFCGLCGWYLVGSLLWGLSLALVVLWLSVGCCLFKGSWRARCSLCCDNWR